MKFDVVISHYKNLNLLQRTLESLAQIELPTSLKTIHLVENGMDSGAKTLIQKPEYACLPLTYHYEDTASLIAARNRGIKESNADFIIFFDNDLKFDKETLSAYDEAFLNHGQSYFFGGPVIPDYEKKPPEQLLGYMPLSVKGFKLGNENKAISSSDFFLGANHALSRKAIEQINKNGEVYSGAGAAGEQGGVGEERRLQKALSEIGYKGMYLSKAVVHHHIPAEVGTIAWVANRYYRYGIEDADNKNQFKSARRLFGLPGWVLKGYLNTTVDMFFNKLRNKEKAYIESRIKRARFKGILDSLRAK